MSKLASVGKTTTGPSSLGVGKTFVCGCDQLEQQQIHGTFLYLRCRPCSVLRRPKIEKYALFNPHRGMAIVHGGRSPGVKEALKVVKNGLLSQKPVKHSQDRRRAPSADTNPCSLPTFV